MKKILLTLTILFTICLSAGCGNMALIDPGNYTFNHIHSDTYHNPMCFDVEKWWDNDNGIEVQTKNNGVLFFGEGDYVLIEDGNLCPYCNGENI